MKREWHCNSINCLVLYSPKANKIKLARRQREIQFRNKAGTIFIYLPRPSKGYVHIGWLTDDLALLNPWIR